MKNPTDADEDLSLIPVKMVSKEELRKQYPSTPSAGEAREWYIDVNGIAHKQFGDNMRDVIPNEWQTVRVIEHSAYAALKAQLDQERIASARIFSDAGRLTEERNAAVAAMNDAHESLRKSGDTFRENDELRAKLSEMSALVERLTNEKNQLTAKLERSESEINRLTFELDLSRESHVKKLTAMTARAEASEKLRDEAIEKYGDAIDKYSTLAEKYSQHVLDFVATREKLKLAVEVLTKIEDFFCACSIDDEIIPQVEARKALEKIK